MGQIAWRMAEIKGQRVRDSVLKAESANLSKAIADNLWLIARSMVVLG